MFIYSVPILFAHMQLGTPLELIFIILLLFAVLYISTPFMHSSDEKHWVVLSDLTLYKYLQHAWYGDLRLWIAFAPFFIILNFILFGTDTLAQRGYLTVSSWDEIHFILATPIIFWTITVWRNSYNTYSRIWAAATRFMTLTVFFEYGLKLLIRKDYPRIFFQCQEITLDYASCF